MRKNAYFSPYRTATPQLSSTIRLIRCRASTSTGQPSFYLIRAIPAALRLPDSPIGARSHRGESWGGKTKNISLPDNCNPRRFVTSSPPDFYGNWAPLTTPNNPRAERYGARVFAVGGKWTWVIIEAHRDKKLLRTVKCNFTLGHD